MSRALTPKEHRARRLGDDDGGGLRFALDAPDSIGQRQVAAYWRGTLLACEKVAVARDYEVKAFAARVAREMPADLGGLRQLTALAEAGLVDALAAGATTAGSDESRHPILRSMADVTSQEIAWLWPNRFPLGKLSLVIGDPGNGKSFWSLDTAARISIGCKWPDGSGSAPIGSVILMGVEDDLADTVKPRLEAAGADVSKIVALTGVANKDESGEYERTVDLRRDISVLESAIQQTTDVRAIIIDPISAFMGKTDSHVNAEVRETLAPLSQLAERYAVAIIAITHLRKGETAALHRAMGSVAFTAAARTVWAIAKDKRDPDGKRRLLLPVKSNVSEDQGGLAFTLTKRHGAPNGMPHIEYEADPVTDTNADDALSNEPRTRGPAPEAQEDAERFLRDALTNGPQPTKQIEQEARDGYGITRRSLERARKSLGVESFRPVIPGPWMLRLSNTANASIHKQPGGLGGLAESSEETADFDHSESNTARLFVRGGVAANSHSSDSREADNVDTVNRLLSEAVEANDNDNA